MKKILLFIWLIGIYNFVYSENIEKLYNNSKEEDLRSLKWEIKKN